MIWISGIWTIFVLENLFTFNQVDRIILAYSFILFHESYFPLFILFVSLSLAWGHANV